MITIKTYFKQKLHSTDLRSAKMKKNTIAMLVIRGVSIGISLLSAPIMLHHVDKADYGVLMTLTSIVAWVGMMDIGLGNGLRNKIPEYLAKKEIAKAQEVVSSCYAALAIYIGILIVAFLIANPFINWQSVLNSPGSNPIEIRNLAAVVFTTFCLQFLFNLVNSILFAYQVPAVQSLFAFLGQVLAFISLLVQIYCFDVTSVFQIGAVNCVMPLIVIIIGSIILFCGRLKEIAPSYKMVNLKSVGAILSLGVKFFVLQIITIVLFQANSIIITRTVGPEAVVEYNMAFKYISVITMIFTIIVTPIWSATTDAYVRQDFEWIKKTLLYIRKVCLLTILIGGLMVVVSPYIYNIWLGKGVIDIPLSTTSFVFLYISFEMLYKVYGTIINGTGKVYAQMIITGGIAIVYIPVAYLLGSLMGLLGVLVANTIVFFINYIWSKIQCNKILNGTANGFWNK